MTLEEARLFFAGAFLILVILLFLKVEFMLLDEMFFKRNEDRAPYGSCEDCQTPCHDCKINKGELN